jgi:hypothetical protein
MIARSGAVVLASLWIAVDPDTWRVIEDQYGPVRAVAVFVLSAAVGVLGLNRTVIAGWLLVALGVLPIAASSLASFTGTVSLSAVSVIRLMTGILYLVSVRLGRRSASVSPPDSGGVLSDSLSDPTAHQ